MYCGQTFGNIVGDGNSEQSHVECPIPSVEYWFSVLCSDTCWVRIYGMSRVLNLSVKAMNTFELYSVNKSLVDFTI